MSLETTQARAEAARAEREWNAHRGHCITCIRAYRAHKPREMCPPGPALYAELKQAQAELAEQRDLDRQPIPGQGTLW